MKHALTFLVWGLAIALAVWTLVCINGCSTTRTPGPTVTTYISKPSQNCMVSNNPPQCIPYQQTQDWISYKSEDFEKLMNWCLNPKGNR